MDVAGCHYNLGWLRERKVDWERAEMHYRKAVPSLEESATTSEFDLPPAPDGLADLLTKRGRYAEAVAQYSRLPVIPSHNNQEETPQVASCRNELGTVWPVRCGEYGRPVLGAKKNRI